MAVGIRGFNQIGFPSNRGVDADAVMKILYAKKHNLFGRMYEGSTLFRAIPRDTGGQGKAMDQPYIVSTGGVVAYDFKKGFDIAVNRATGPGYASAKFGWDNQFAHWSIDSKQKKQMPSRGKGSYVNAVRQILDRTKERMERLRLAHLYGDGSGALGQIKSVDSGHTTTSATFELMNHVQPIYFEKGIFLEFTTNSTDTVPLTAGSSPVIQRFQVESVDRKANKVTVKPVSSTGADVTAADAAHIIALIKANNYIFGEGDVVNIPNVGPESLSPYTGTRVFGGFAAWRPESLPANDSFYGIDRNQDPVRLSGVVHELSSFSSTRPYQDTLIAAAYRQRTLGGRIKNIVMNPLHHRDFVYELSGSTEYRKIDMKGSAKGVPGFRAIQIAYGQGDLMIHEDIHCPPGVAWGYVASDWKLCSLDQFIHVWNEDGRIVDRIQGENRFGGSIQSYAALICRNPINLARIKLPALNSI